VIVGAPGPNSTLDRGGAAYVYHGYAGALLSKSQRDGPANSARRAGNNGYSVFQAYGRFHSQCPLLPRYFCQVVTWMGGKCVTLRAIGKVYIPVLPGGGIARPRPSTPSLFDDLDHSLGFAEAPQRREQIVVHKRAGQYHLTWRVFIVQV